jgi:uncharacterized protein
MKIRDLDLSNHPVNAEHQALGLPPVERELAAGRAHPVLRVAMWSVLLLMGGCIAWLATRLAQRHDGCNSSTRCCTARPSGGRCWWA